MENPNRRKATVTDSRMAMWKAAIGFAHIDHQLSNSEIDLIHNYFEEYDFSEAQLAELDKDLRSGVDIDTVFPQITEKRDRAHLINFALILFHIDGDFSEEEQALWEKINAAHAHTIDLKEAIKEAHQACQQFDESEKVKRQVERDNATLFEKAFSFFVDFDD